MSESWYPANDQQYGVLLEDDIEVSPLFYRWIWKCLDGYMKNPDPRMVGISLYTPRVTETIPDQKRKRFNTTELMTDLIHDPTSPYLIQTPCRYACM